jgi:hypothetical protein
MWDQRIQIPVDRVHDGDTLYDVYVDEGERHYHYEDIRLLGVFAPELDDPGGPECRQFVLDWIKDVLASYGNNPPKWPFVRINARMKVKDAEQKTLDRFVSTITNMDGTRNLNAEIIQFIHENGYSGGTGSQ